MGERRGWLAALALIALIGFVAWGATFRRARAIADRREFYNESVNINNVGIEQFPEVLIARWFKFKPFDLLRFQADELKDVDVGQAFSR